MKKIFFFFLFLVNIYNIPAFSQADTASVEYSVSDTLINSIRLFDSEEILNITLSFDITFYKKKKPDKEYIDGVLEYSPDGTDTIRKSIKLRTRGEFRRTYCDYPPIRLNFKKTESFSEEFNRVDKLKMVTHCRAGYGEYVLREYLCYKLFNILTDNSFKVRLLRINYINTNPKIRRTKPTIEYAFVIEPSEHLAQRTNCVEIKVPTLTQRSISQGSMDRLALFNYMIGNTDWSVPGLHNLVVLSRRVFEAGGAEIITVPYDFDYCGLVNATYAIPYEKLPIRSVRERYFTGMCRSEEELKTALKEFTDKKEEFYRVINEFPYLGPKSRKDIIMFLEEFYNLYDKRNGVIYRLLTECKDL